jgi:hypothetical protein
LNKNKSQSPSFLLPDERKNFSDNSIVLPLIFSDGYYKTKFTLTDGKGYQVKFSAIPDTGSHLLLLSGVQCKECVNSDGVWSPEKGEARSKNNYTITYGGGQKTEFIPWQAYFVDSSIGQAEPDLRIAEFGLITSHGHQSVKPENVMGLSPQMNTGRKDERSFLDSLAVPKRLIFDFPRNQLVIGEDERSRPVNFDNQAIKLVQNGSYSYPFALIDSINLEDKKIENSVKYAVLDTGTNYTVIPRNLYDSIVKANSNLGLPKEIEFNFAGKNGLVKKKFSTRYFIAGNVPIANTLILGAKAFDSKSLLIDYDKKEINF